MSMPVSSTVADELSDWCRAHFQYVYSSQTYTQDIYFHISNTEFDVPVHYADLLYYEPDFANMQWSGDTTYNSLRIGALTELYDRLSAAGYKPWKIINKDNLKTTFAYLWIAYICRGFAKSNGIYWERMVAYRDEFEKAFKSLMIKEDSIGDADNIGTITSKHGRTKLVRG